MLLWVLVIAMGALLNSALLAQSVPPAGGRLIINLEDALERAHRVNPLFQSAVIGSELAREDKIQARAALLPSLNYSNQYIYTQGNGTPSGIFVANDGVHVYNSQAVIHGDIFSPGKRAEYQRAQAADALARAKVEIARRGLAAAVVESYYGLIAAERKYAHAQQSVREARQFADITQKQEHGGEAAHADVVKAQILAEQRARETQEAELNVERSRIGLAVMIFPDFRQDFSVVDDFDSIPPLAELAAIRNLAMDHSPEVQAAQAALRQETLSISIARSALLPTLSFDYFYGIDANQFATYNHRNERNLGSVAQGSLNIPVFTWGAARSRVRQAELRREQAQIELGAAERQLLANLNSFYREAEIARAQLDSLRGSADLASESLRLTLLRYEAGEATALEVVDAQVTLTEARNAYDDGVTRYRVALASLQTLTGTF